MIFRSWVTRLLRNAGAGEVTLAPLCGSRGDPGKAKAVLEASDLVFISGGDVEEGMRVLEEKGMTGFLRRLHRAGKLFFGISAGSIMLSRKWVRWRDPHDDGSAELFPCLGFAPHSMRHPRRGRRLGGVKGPARAVSARDNRLRHRHGKRHCR